MRVPVRVITSQDEVTALLATIFPNGSPAEDWSIVGLDTEYTQDDGNICLYYLQVSNGKQTYVIDGPGTSAARGNADLDLIESLAEWIACPKAKKIISTVRAEYRGLKKYAELRGVLIDTEQGDWFWDENRFKHGLKECACAHLDLPMKSYAETFGFVPQGKKRVYVPSMSEITWGSDKYSYMPWTGAKGREKAEKYAGLDPYATYKLGMKQITRLKETDLHDWYMQVERPLGLTLLKMEERGIGLDLHKFEEIQQQAHADVMRKRHLFRSLVDRPQLNLRANEQLRNLFLFELGWKPVVMTKPSKKHPKGQPSFGKEALGIYADKDFELAKLLLDFRVSAHNESSFLNPMSRNYKIDDGVCRLFTCFHQSRTVTGRLSSGDKREGLINFQNIPAMEDRDPYHIRSMFVPTRKGWRLIVGDYSMIELYILAQISGDKVMCEAFANGEDLHTLTACKVWGLPYPGTDKDKQAEFKEKYGDYRKRAKPINFGICVAEGQRVLTHVGLVPIERVQDWHKLWDGVEWVAHDGVICNGRRPVMSYGGVTATPDHLVYTKEGACVSLEDAASTIRPRQLAVGAVGEVPVRYTAFDRRGSAGSKKQAICNSGLPCVRGLPAHARGQYQGQEDQELSLPVGACQVWPRPESGHLGGALRRYGSALLQGYACVISQLQRARDQSLVQVSGGLCTVGAEEVAFARDVQEEGLRQEGQRWSLLQGQSSSGDSLSESEKQTALVYDIVNAGPRHRFTVEGKIVSNCYGMSAHTLGKRIKATEEEAEKYIAAYFDLYKGAKHWIDETIESAHETGCVWTPGGYIRHLPDINSPDKSAREHAERQATNAPIQGWAAQIIKVVMNALEFGAHYKTKFMQHVPEVAKLKEWGVEQLLQVHDEIVLQTPPEVADEATAIVQKVMEASFKDWFTKVTIHASVGNGLTWSDAKV